MTKMQKPAVFRGAVKVRADETNPTVLVQNINKAFEEFKATHADTIKSEINGAIDVLDTEKLSKINSSIDDLQKSIEDHAEKIGHLKGGGSADGDAEISAEEREYQSKFLDWFKTGENEGELRQATMSNKVRAALTTGSDEDGGYTTPVEWDRTITEKFELIGGMRRYATVQSVRGRGFTRLFDVLGVGAGWVGETDARPETASPKLSPYTYSFGEIYANPAASQNILDDSEINISTWLANSVAQKFMVEEGTAFVNGDGVNKPKGLLQYDAVTEAALPPAQQHPLGGIGIVNSGSATLLTTDGLIDLQYDLPSELNANSAYYMNRATQGAVRKMKDGQGNYIWQAPFAAGEPPTLLGQAQRELSGMPNVAAGNFAVGYGDMSMTYSIFDRLGISILRDPYTNKPYVLFYTTKRVGGGLWNPEYFRFQQIAAA